MFSEAPELTEFIIYITVIIIISHTELCYFKDLNLTWISEMMNEYMLIYNYKECQRQRVHPAHHV